VNFDEDASLIKSKNSHVPTSTERRDDIIDEVVESSMPKLDLLEEYVHLFII